MLSNRSSRINTILTKLGEPVMYSPRIALALQKANPRCGVEESVVLAALIELPQNEYGWVRATNEFLQTRTGMRSHELVASIRHLGALGVLSEAPLSHFQINLSALDKIVAAMEAESDQT